MNPRHFPSVPENNPGDMLGNLDVREEGQRSDLRPDALEVLINSKGYRLCWNRAARCPCPPINTQTRQPSPNCRLCHGKGWIWYGDEAVQNLAGEKFTPSQSRILNATGGLVIRGMMSMMGREQNPLDKLGHWINGTASLTVSSASRISYFDRLINLDSVVTYAQILEAPADSTQPLPTDYLVAGGVFLVRSVNRRYRPGQDFTVRDGSIYMQRAITAPKPGERLSVHYVCHPTWIVMTEPHAVRGTNLRSRAANRVSREGVDVNLPLQAAVRLEYLPFPGGSNDSERDDAR